MVDESKHSVALQAHDYTPDGGISLDEAQARGMAPADAFLLIRVLRSNTGEVYAMSAFDGATKGELTFEQKFAIWHAFTAGLLKQVSETPHGKGLQELLRLMYVTFAERPPEPTPTGTLSLVPDPPRAD